jgi:hypothetical protein
MNPLDLRLHLEIAGVLILGLAVLNVFVGRYFGWRRELAPLPLLTRRVFWVHSMFIILVLALFGLCSLCCAGTLLEPAPLSRAVLAGMACFWLVRLLFQFVVYEPAIWRGNRFYTAMHYCFALLWTYLATTYSVALVEIWS